MMTKKMKEAAKGYRLPETGTPEQLECAGLKTVSYGTKTICTGYFYTCNGNCHYAAVYEFTGSDHTCEGECRLAAVSEERFEDDGHAIEWALGTVR